MSNHVHTTQLKCAAIVLLASVLAHTAVARSVSKPSIILERSMPVSTDGPARPHAETFLALNPTDANQMLATSIAFEGGTRRPVVYASRDAGLTWKRTAPSERGGPSMFEGGDPIVYFDAAGAVFGSIQGTPVGFRIWRSLDRGLTWKPPVTVPGGIYDRPYLVVDQSSPRYAGRMYAAGIVGVHKTGDGSRYPVIAVTRSSDHGMTFAPEVFLDTKSSGYTLAGVADLLVARDGTLIIPFETGPTGEGDVTTRRGQLWAVVSTDGGETFLPARPGPQLGIGSGFRAARTSVARRAAIDQSRSVFADRVYVTWVDFARERYDVKVTYSDDFGRTWSVPVTVNDNSATADPANPAIAVNRDGIVAITFNDRRDDPQHECYRLYASFSIDGGATFMPNVQLNSGSTCTSAVGNWPGMILSDLRTIPSTGERRHLIGITGVPERFPNGGDTQGLVGGPDGKFHSAWINGASGVTQLWYTSFRVEPRTAVAPAVIDRTESVSVEADEPVVDFSAKSLTFTARLRNVSLEPIPGPLLLTLQELESDLRGLRAVNADNAPTARGAKWSFVTNKGGVLAPNGVSETRQLAWHFDGTVPQQPRRRFLGHFRVMGSPQEK